MGFAAIEGCRAVAVALGCAGDAATAAGWCRAPAGSRGCDPALGGTGDVPAVAAEVAADGVGLAAAVAGSVEAVLLEPSLSGSAAKPVPATTKATSVTLVVGKILGRECI